MITEERPNTFKADLKDIIQVFVYTNLSTIAAPDPLLRLPPGTAEVLDAYINFLPGGLGFPSDIQEILNAFILTNINSISVELASPVASQNSS